MSVQGYAIRLQTIPLTMTFDEVLDWVGEEVLNEYKNHAHAWDS